MIWYEVGIAYFPFFLGAGGFFAAGFFSAGFSAVARFAAAATPGAGFLSAVFFAGLVSPFVSALATAFFAGGATFGAAAASATGSSVWPSAPASTSTTSDQRRWNVETSAYGIT